MPSPPAETLARLFSHFRETALLTSIDSLLAWDERTQLPAAAGEYRAQQMTYLAGLIHRRWVDPRVSGWLAELSDWAAISDATSPEVVAVRELRRQHEKRLKLPQSLVEELARMTVLGQQAWVEAREQNDFARFRPFLEKIFALKRHEADALGHAGCRYDALLDQYEPGENERNLSATLGQLREALVPLVRAIAESGRKPNREILHRRFPADLQQCFGKEAARRIGYSFERGRLDTTAHPFCTNLGPDDCRITTRYDEQFFPSAYFGILHEAGHGLYEQGLPREHYGLPPGEACSLGIHESQSRMWENLVGRSGAYWEHAFPEAQRAFPAALGDVSLSDFYFAINDVRPTLIRVEADEATYNLHILARFELERDLLADNLTAGDLPDAWREKYRHLLGIEPENDAQGVMQDIHWSAGLIGYFPTYSLGNLYAAQFFERARSDLGDLDAQFRRGEFQPLLDWLRNNVHAPGQTYRASQLVERVTESPLSHAPLMRHLRTKLGELYGID